MTPRDRRAIALGVGAVVLAVLGLRVVPWSARAYAALRERAAGETATLQQARRAVSSLPAARDSLAETLADFLALAPRILAGQSSAEASATLSGLMSTRALDAHLRVAQLDQLPDSSAGTFSKVAVRGTLEGDVRGLTAFVGALETGNPIVTLDQLVVTATNANAPGATTPEALRIEVVVHGWFLPRAAQPASAPHADAGGGTP